MKIIVNQNIQEYKEDTNLENVLEQNSMLDKSGIAVAVNEEIIPRSEWQKTILFDDDKIIIIGAVAGG